ncbi:alpha/beta-hydrolase [Sporormia fimetaria CBS 119925]|uniref:Alpha/beta-hydrolase n=1 Tax=Sporormia fimetaria CBS 119925 TaxID=1340428 RepID=A0A6A6V5B1_9PLEO|nr:alpha/beta-hydrolase [Sporormia fimetaria CBS 119925]
MALNVIPEEQQHHHVQEQSDDIQPYSMHVSSRYLDLTKKKLELTRLPKEIVLSEKRRWDLGTPKAVLEPLLDYWLDTYDWRSQEAHFNTTLPQFRTTIKLDLPASSPPSSSSSTPSTTPQSLRIHFVHKRSKHRNAIPLLFCHNWPASFLEVQKVIDALTDPQSLPSFGAGAQQAFHVVAPSIPGFGFSDAGAVEGFGLKETAQVFDGVMQKLGYGKYVAHGTKSGFHICRALALGHPDHCLAVHTTNPAFAEPKWKKNPLVYIKHRIARWTRAKYLSFGYTPAEVEHQTGGRRTEKEKEPEDASSNGAMLSPLYALRPQTLAYSLCDSPVGLLAGLLDVIHTRVPSTNSQSPITSRSRSPFLSPMEMEMEDPLDLDEERSSLAVHSGPVNPQESEINARIYTWAPTEVLNWTMLHWLPGPESSLRWLRRATLDMATDSPLTDAYCPVPLGISSFQVRNSSSAPNTPLMWGSASWRMAWVKRHQRPATISPAWEAPDLLVLDMRECFGTFVADGIVNLPFQEG